MTLRSEACYYNAKTATKNGQWNIGIGVGVRLNWFKNNGYDP
jgi:hypothetical protein